MTEFAEYTPFIDALYDESNLAPSRELDHHLPAHIHIPCLAIGKFPELTKSGNRFRVPGFCSAIKPRFLLVQRKEDSDEVRAADKTKEPDSARNTLLDMSELLKYLAPLVNPRVPHGVARQALQEVEGLWNDIMRDLQPKPEMRDEFLIAYFYQPMLGCGKDVAHMLEAWYKARAAWLSGVCADSLPGTAVSDPHQANFKGVYPIFGQPFGAASSLDAKNRHDYHLPFWSNEDRLIMQLSKRKPKKGSASVGGAESYRPPAAAMPPPSLDSLLAGMIEPAATNELSEELEPHPAQPADSWGRLTSNQRFPHGKEHVPASFADLPELSIDGFRKIYPFALEGICAV